MKLPSINSLTDPKTIIPVGIGAAILGYGGHWLSKKVKIPVLPAKLNGSVMIIAGVLVGAMAGKWASDKFMPKSTPDYVPPVQEKASIPTDTELSIQ